LAPSRRGTTEQLLWEPPGVMSRRATSDQQPIAGISARSMAMEHAAYLHHIQEGFGINTCRAGKSSRVGFEKQHKELQLDTWAAQCAMAQHHA
jgi:hypothetical protein